MGTVVGLRRTRRHCATDVTMSIAGERRRRLISRQKRSGETKSSGNPNINESNLNSTDGTAQTVQERADALRIGVDDHWHVLQSRPARFVAQTTATARTKQSVVTARNEIRRTRPRRTRGVCALCMQTDDKHTTTTTTSRQREFVSGKSYVAVPDGRWTERCVVRLVVISLDGRPLARRDRRRCVGQRAVCGNLDIIASRRPRRVPHARRNIRQ